MELLYRELIEFDQSHVSSDDGNGGNSYGSIISQSQFIFS